MISSAQRKAVRAFTTRSTVSARDAADRLLDKLWKQRLDWWFAHTRGAVDREAVHAAKAAQLRSQLTSTSEVPSALLDQWEREWDDYFEAWFRRMGWSPE